MTQTAFQQLLHRLYQGDNDYPSSITDTNWIVRQAILEASIRQWDAEEGILWRELWEQLSDASDGVKTIAASTLTYNCPTDMRRFLGGYVRLTDSAGVHTFLPVVEQHKAELDKNNTSSNWCYFTGSYTESVGGFKLNFVSQQTIGLTINYPYYKTPTIPSAGAHIIEMSDPMFAIEYSLSKLHELDGEGDRASLALAKANSLLKAMRVNNSVPGWYQDNYAPDRDTEIGIDSFGN